MSALPAFPDPVEDEGVQGQGPPGVSSARLRLDRHLLPSAMRVALEPDVRAGLTASPKTLPPKWFYDARGSELFSRITTLEEYYPTRREHDILRARAAQIAELTRADTLIELGSGTSEKTRVLLDALTEAGALRAVRRR